MDLGPNRSVQDRRGIDRIDQLVCSGRGRRVIVQHQRDSVAA